MHKDEELDELVPGCYQRLSHDPQCASDLIVGLIKTGGQRVGAFVDDRDPLDLDRAVALFRRALSGARDDDPAAPLGMLALGTTLLFRYERFGDESYMEAFFRCRSQDAASRGYIEELAVSDAGVEGRSREEVWGLADDDDGSILADVWTRQPQDGSAQARSRPLLQRSVGFRTWQLHILLGTHVVSSLGTRYEQDGKPAGLFWAIAYCRRMLERIPRTRATGSVRSRLWDLLGHALSSSYAMSGSAGELEHAIQARIAALALHPPHHVGRADALHGLAVSVYKRFQERGDLSDLAQAVEMNREVLVLRPLDDRDRPRSLCNLASMVEARFTQLGRVEDLEEAILLHRETLELCPPDHPVRMSYLTGLGGAVMARFKLLGDLDDLEDSVRLNRAALRACSLDQYKRPVVLGNLAAGVHIRFRQLGALDDIEEVVRLLHEALSLTPPSHENRCQLLDSLASAILDRFDWGGGPDPLEKVVQLRRESLALLPPGNVSYYRALASYGSALFRRYRTFGDPDDLDASVRLSAESLKHCPPGHRDRPSLLVILAQALLIKSDSTGRQALAVDCRSLISEALSLSPPGHANRSPYLAQLAASHLAPSTSFTDVDYALQLMHAAIRDDHDHPRRRLRNGTVFIEHAEKLGPMGPRTREHLLAVYISAVRLLPKVAYFGLDMRARLDGLVGAEWLGIGAASHALRLADPATAIEVLEAGRGVFWSQALRLRTPFDGIPGHLRSALVRASRRLEASSFGQDSPRSGDLQSKAAIEAQVAARRKDSERFDCLVEEVRRLPGFERFMLHDEYELLAKAAAKGPVVVLVGTKIACAAILIKPSGEADRVDLQMNLDDLCGLSGRLKTADFRSGETEQTGRALKLVGLLPANKILGELWTKVVKPIVIALGLAKSTGRSRPRIWWCPTGKFVFLPLHAAGIYTPQYVDCCSDYFVSSYTPTLTALLNARRDFVPIEKRDAKVLAAASPVPYRGNRLPSTIIEVNAVKSIVPPKMLVPLPAEDDCSIDRSAGLTKKTMQEQLPKASILHLSCHGVQDRKNALESGFILRDSMLTVSDLMAMPLPRAFLAFLAFLSACETAQGDTNQPDQAIHLAATMLFAGFRSVVATMWEMFDCDGPIVAKAVYGALFKDGAEFLDPDDVPYALDAVTREMRAKKLSASHWATFIHLGM